MSPLLLVMGVDEPNKLGRVAELVTIGGAFFNLVLVIRDDIYLISILLIREWRAGQ